MGGVRASVGGGKKRSCSACNYLGSYEVLRTLILARKYVLLRKNNPVAPMPRPNKTVTESLHLIAGQQRHGDICLHFIEQIYYYGANFGKKQCDRIARTPYYN